MATEEWNALGDDLPSIETVQEKINKRYDKLFHYDKTGKRHAFVCTVCNEFIRQLEDVNYIPIPKMKAFSPLLAWDNGLPSSTDVPQRLKDYYVFQDIDGHLQGSDIEWMEGVAFSPRGVIGKKPHQRQALGFSCCSSCKSALTAKEVPFFAIANGNYVGHAPPCLKDLTPVELALLTPVKGYGYSFTYSGGQTMKLQGNMTFLRVEERTIARALAQLESLHVTKTVTITLTGNMTASQKQRVKNQIRIEKLMEAAHWLTENHVDWKNVTMQEFQDEFKDKIPHFVDKSTTVDSENANVEEQELFRCYFPDSALNETSGGFDSREDFKNYVEEMQRKGNFDISVRMNLEKDFSNDNNDILVCSSLLQFPYGICGPSEMRVKDKEGAMTNRTDLERYIRHLNQLSEVEFHAPMFVLIEFSMLSKVKLLRRSRLQVRGKHTAAQLANGLTAADVSASIRGREVGDRQAGTEASRKLLNAVDACSQALPHTNQASKQARSTGEAMQHHFGIPSIFLTVTFDDENSLVMQVLHGIEIDDDTDLKDLRDDELAHRCTKRKELRLGFPGIAALNFDMLLNICMEEVVGWSMRKNEPTENPGIFGHCEALAIAFEEQGRTTVHGHASAWIRGFKELQKTMFFGDKEEKRMANSILAKYNERVMTTSMFEHDGEQRFKYDFDHECCIPHVRDRQAPIVVDDQQLRNLRHKKGWNENDGAFAYCPHCRYAWTYEELLNSYVRTSAEYARCMPCTPPVGNADEDENEAEDKGVLPKARMYSNILQFQRKRGADVEQDTPVVSINASYQHHLSCHVKGCFKCNKGPKAHKCGPTCECRMRLPDRSRPSALVRVLNDSVTWFEWTGKTREQPLIDFLPKRTKYNNFQNVSCKVISESKLSCNSNVALMTDGPVTQYQFKYQHKSTQGDDTQPYKRVEAQILSAADTRTHVEDDKEANRKICCAAFAHNKQNVIGPSMASFQLEHGSRFYFSHRFVYCPVKDVIKVLNNSAVEGVARFEQDGNIYFENQALHYLCRPEELEDVSVKEFFEEFNVVNMSYFAKCKKRKRDEDEVLPFLADSGFFKHPSAYTPKRKTTTSTTKKKPKQSGKKKTTATPRKTKSKTNANPSTPKRTPKRRRTAVETPRRRLVTPSRPNSIPGIPEELRQATKQGVKEKEAPVLIKVPQWMFPDAAKFKGNILTCPEGEITNDMEIYAQLVLVLFLPHRCLNDLKSSTNLFTNKPFTMKLREVNAADEELRNQNEEPRFFNEKNQRFLQNIQDCAYNSMRYKVPKDDLATNTVPFSNYEGATDHVEDNEDEQDEEDLADFFADMFADEIDVTDSDPSFLFNTALKNFNFKQIRMRGRFRCGFNDLLPCPELQTSDEGNASDFVKYNLLPEFDPSIPKQAHARRDQTPGLKSIVELLYQRSVLRGREEVFKHNKEAKVPSANGSVQSIIAWGKAATLDDLQMRAFQSIIASFVLTFFDTDPESDSEADITNIMRARFRQARRRLLFLKGGQKAVDKNEKQLIMLLHGPGGSGKSTVINLVVNYAKEYCENLEHPFTKRTIVITAMSGVAATLLHGETAHSAMGLNRDSFSDEMMEAWEDARLIFVDEMSFAAEGDYRNMCVNTQILTNNRFKPFGDKNIVWAGDFSQLEPPCRTPIYKGDRCPYFHDMLNAFIELNGMHRFKDDPEWGHRLMRFRMGHPTEEDIRIINDGCLVSTTHRPPAGIQVACHRNKDRDAVNCAMFETFCAAHKPTDGSIFEGAIFVLMDSLEMKDSNDIFVGVKSNAVKRHFWAECGEDDCNFGSNNNKRVDPVLKLYANCPLMFTENKDVPNGQANGSRILLKSVQVKFGEQPQLITLACGTKIRAFFASQIATLSLKHETDDIVPNVFEVKPSTFTFTANMHIHGEEKKVAMRGNQFPVISNNATTGHKLQGYTATNLLANDWFYGQNWPYVVLSRVRTMAGLYIKETLDEDTTRYAMPEEMMEMLAEFKERHLLEPLPSDMAENFIRAEEGDNFEAQSDEENDN